MLLSTDWFLPYWTEIGIGLEHNKKALLQQACREIVDQMIGGTEQYYYISFSPERLDATRDQFERIVEQVDRTDQTRGQIRELLSPDPHTAGTRWLLTLNTEMLVRHSTNLPSDETIPKLSAHIMRVLQDWSGRGPERIDLNGLCMNSNTNWDAHVRSLTPEQPASLADHAQTALIGELKFKRLLATVVTLTEEEKIELQAWYTAIARKLVDADDIGERISAELATSN